MVMIIKQSGNPVDKEEAEAYSKEWKEGFDKLFDAKGDMAVVSDKAKEYEEELMRKYKIENSVELPKSMKAWKLLLEQHGSGIMVDQNVETGDLMFVILDLGL